MRPHVHLRFSKFSQHFIDVLDLEATPLDYFGTIFPDMILEERRKFLGEYKLWAYAASCGSILCFNCDMTNGKVDLDALDRFRLQRCPTCLMVKRVVWCLPRCPEKLLIFCSWMNLPII